MVGLSFNKGKSDKQRSEMTEKGRGYRWSPAQEENMHLREREQLT